ncbi:hypothetical protein CHH83_09800 [Bacillus sp. 7586-K]|uniref:LacI family DNA-binding transcriptional regulator n=1 Tax=Metabacillus niabensis TaxID=324854 RepID=UPI000BA750CA|nr:hypothetical protein CHH83_09800 [Bacillus sp. 7586-K]
MGKKVTIQQIADYLGVSKYVVSRALSGKSGVKDATRDKVLEAAKQLGYQPQVLANAKDSLHSTKAGQNNVLVVLPKSQYQDSIYWGRIIDGISNELEGHSLGIVMMTESDSFSTVINPKGFIGIICVGHISTNILLEFKKWEIPVVLIDDEEPLFSTDTIFANNFDSSFQLTNYLIGLGHRDMIFIGDIYFSRSFYDRWLGFRSALESHQLVPKTNEVYLEKREKDYEEMIISAKKWLEIAFARNEMPTAIVCANDSIALYMIDLLKAKKLNIPEDISITGFDNIESSYLNSPTLTTIHVPKEQLGKKAVTVLIDQIHSRKEQFEKILLTCELIIRESTAKLKSLI